MMNNVAYHARVRLDCKKKDDVLRWIVQWFTWGGWGVGGWVGGGLMTCVVDCQQR